MLGLLGSGLSGNALSGVRNKLHAVFALKHVFGHSQSIFLLFSCKILTEKVLGVFLCPHSDWVNLKTRLPALLSPGRQQSWANEANFVSFYYQLIFMRDVGQ